MDVEELRDFFQDGIVTDLMYATRHYFIWRTIGENFDQIKQLNNPSFDHLMGEIQNSSHDLAIIRLSKIYDKQSTKYPIRCIPQILNLDISSTVYFPIHTENYDEFAQISKLIPSFKLPSTISTTSEFSEIFKLLLGEVALKEIIDKLKFIRDKTIAHNEHNIRKYDFHALNFWNEYTTLLYFTKSFILLFGNVFLSSYYFQFSYKDRNEIHFSILSDLYWLRDLIESKVGRDKFVQWWI